MVLFKQIAACIIFTSCYVHPSRSLPPQDARAYRVFPNSPKLPESGNYHHQFQFPSRLQTYREYNAFTKPTLETISDNKKPKIQFYDGKQEDTFIPQLKTPIPSHSRTGDDIYVSPYGEAISKKRTVNIPDKVGVYYYPKPIIPFHEETTKYTNIHSKILHPDENTYGDDVYVSSSTEATSEKVTIQIVDKVTGNDSPVPRKPFDRRTGQVNLIQQPSTLTPSDTRSGDDKYVSSSTEAILTNNTVNIPDKFCGCYNHKPSIPFDEVTKTDTPIHSTTPLPDENTNGDDVYVSAYTKATTKIDDDVTGNSNLEPREPFDVGTGKDTFDQHLTTIVPSDSGNGKDIYVSSSTEAITKNPSVNIPVEVGVYYYPKPIIPFHEETTKYTNIHSKIPHPDENTYGDDVYVSSSTEATSEKVTIQIVDKVTGNDSPVPRKPFDRRTGQVNLIQQPSTLTPSDTKSGDDKYVSSSTEAILTNNTVNIPDKFCGCYNHKSSIPFDEVTKTDTPIHSTTPLPDENTNGDDVYVSAYTKATTKIDDDVTGNSNLEPREPFDVGTGKDTFDQHLTTIVPSDSGNGKDIYVSSSTEAITKNPSVNIPVEVGVYYYPKPIIPFHEETTKYTNIHSKIPHPDENTYGDDVYVSSSTEATSEKVTIQIVDKVTGSDSPVPRKPFDRRTGQVNLIQQPSTLTPSDTRSGDDEYVSSSTEAILTNNTVNIPDKFCGCYNHKPSIPFDEVTKTDTPIHSTTPLPDENTNGDDVYVSAYSEATTKIDDDVTGNSNLEPREPFDVGTGKDTFDQHLTTIVPSDSGNGKDIYVSSSTEAITKNPSVNIPVEVGVYYYPKPIIPFHEETTKYTNIHSKIPHPDENTYGDDVYVSSSTEATSEKVTIQIVDKVTGNDSPVPRKPFDRRTGQVNLIQQPSTLTPSDTRSGDDKYVSSSTEAILTNNTVNIPDKFCGCYNHKPSIPFDEVTKTDTPIHSTTPLPDENTNGDDVYVSAYSEATTKIDDDVTGNFNLEPREPFDVGTGKDTFDQHLTTIVPSDSGNGKDYYVSSSTEAIPEKHNVKIHRYYYPKPNKPWEDRIKRDTYVLLTNPLLDQRSYGL